MKIQRLFKVIIPIFLIFVVFGDMFLPAPFSDVSSNIKQGADQFFKGLFPSYKPLDPQKRTREEIEQLNNK